LLAYHEKLDNILEAGLIKKVPPIAWSVYLCPRLIPKWDASKEKIENKNLEKKEYFGYYL